MTTAPTSHARLAPSSSNRWIPCPYSAQHDLPESTNQAALDGRGFHESAAFALLHNLPLFGAAERSLVKPFVDYVQAQPGERFIETWVDSAIVPEFGGTLDAVLVTPQRLHIPDLKTGKWKVPAAQSTQLLCYGTLAREKFGRRPEYVLTIIQPKVYAKPNTITVTDRELDAHLGRVIIAAGSSHKAVGSWCRFCPLRPQCPEGQDFAAGQGWP